MKEAVFTTLATPEKEMTIGEVLLKTSPVAPREEHPDRPRGIAIPEKVASEALALSSRYNLEIQAAYRRAAELQSRREALESARVNGSPGAMVELVGKYNEEDDNLSSMPKAGSLVQHVVSAEAEARKFNSTVDALLEKSKQEPFAALGIQSLYDQCKAQNEAFQRAEYKHQKAVKVFYEIVEEKRREMRSKIEAMEARNQRVETTLAEAEAEFAKVIPDHEKRLEAARAAMKPLKGVTA